MDNRSFIPRTVAALLAVLTLTASVAAAQTGTYSASGYGARVSTLLGQLVATPSVGVVPGDNVEGATVAGTSLPGALSTGLLTAISTGATDPAVTGAQTTSTLANISVLNGLIVARQLVASASSTVSDGVARSDAQGSSVEGLRIAGMTIGDQLPAPNTRINLPGVGYAILNEQVLSGNGVTTSGITVNLIHVVTTGLFGTKTGEIILGSARSSVVQ